jgi:hypothetical protein
MKFEVTRDVVSDLWPLCRSGEASADSRALVDAFLSEDAHFASTLRYSENLTGVMPSVRLSPDAERCLLNEARKRAQWKLLVAGAAVALAGLIAFSALGGLLYMMSRGL